MSTDTEIKVSIVIPVYQAKDTLKRCVLSCMNQKFVSDGELEIILVDDGSTDGSSALCDELSKDDAAGRIKVIHSENRGVSCARNTGLKSASGRFVAFVDADDEVTESFLENLMKYADEDTALVDETDVFSGSRKISGFQYIENVTLGGNSHVWGKLFDRKTIAENNVAFKEGLTIGEDLLFLIDFALAQGKKHVIRLIPEGDYLYRENPEGAMKSSFKEGYLDEIKCWRLAEEKLLPFAAHISRYAFVSLAVSQILTAFLVLGKVAVMDDGKEALKEKAVSLASKQIKHALKTQGAFAALPIGHKIKVILFRISPALYLRMYGAHKR